jgi:hypothetical protein
MKSQGSGVRGQGSGVRGQGEFSRQLSWLRQLASNTNLAKDRHATARMDTSKTKTESRQYSRHRLILFVQIRVRSEAEPFVRFVVHAT